MRRTLCIVVVAALAGGCAASKQAGRTTRAGITGAVTQPLEDFNLLRDKIPAVLRRAQDQPYEHPQPASCEYIRSEVVLLDDALGPDTDVKDPAPSGRMAQGGAMIGRQTVDAVRDLTTDWIPMRNWVRRLTGAQQHSSQVQKAINAGTARRAYLKGMASAQGCPIRAAPMPTQFPAPPSTPSSAG
jgi:hypothetical protein